MPDKKPHFYLILVVLVLLIFGGAFYLYRQQVNKPKFLSLVEFAEVQKDLHTCKFEIVDMEESKGKSSSGYYVIYTGLIKNNGEQKESLKAMIAHVYNQERVLIADGYKSIEKSVDPGVLIPFSIYVDVDVLHNITIGKYFNLDTTLVPDVYPWFTSCK